MKKLKKYKVSKLIGFSVNHQNIKGTAQKNDMNYEFEKLFTFIIEDFNFYFKLFKNNI